MGKTSEVENASLVQKLGMAVPDRTISTLHLLSIPPNLGQDFAKTCKSCSGLMFHITPAGNIIFPSPLFTAPSGLFPPVDPPPQPHVGQVKLGGILPVTGCSTAVPDSAGLDSQPEQLCQPVPLQQPFVPHLNQCRSLKLHGHLSSSF